LIDLCVNAIVKQNGSDLAHRTTKTTTKRDIRAQRTDEQIHQDNEDMRANVARLRVTQDEQNQKRRSEARQFAVDARRANVRQRQQVHRAFTSESFLRLTFECGPDIKYYAHSKVEIGVVWTRNFRSAMRLNSKMSQPVGMCCASGKVQLPEIEITPDSLNGLLISGTDPVSNLYLITFNLCFQMTSFGATEKLKNNNAAGGQQFKLTFEIKCQVYQKLGSLLPMPNEPHTFLQIYFMGGENSESALASRVDARCSYSNSLNDSPFSRRIISVIWTVCLFFVLNSNGFNFQLDCHAQ